MVQVKESNADGLYSFVNVSPGRYSLEVRAPGFETGVQPGFSLEVNQTATINFTMKVGSATDVVNVSGQAVALETSTAELGTVVHTKEVNDLPLNGRNFTELLLLTPGVSAANPLQNSGGANGGIGAFVIPAVNGQTNRSNMFLLDGVTNFGAANETYALQPTIDDVMEFKVQSHNDEAQFGQVLGGIVNLVTKSGGNSFHGSGWEFLRNDALDANNYFNSKTELKQNQFGGSVGGPVLLPHYNGRNKTFFYASYEGFRKSGSSTVLYLTPTPAQLAGDFSAVSAQIYNPYSTQPDPANPGSFVNSPFMCDGSGNALLPTPMASRLPGHLQQNPVEPDRSYDSLLCENPVPRSDQHRTTWIQRPRQFSQHHRNDQMEARIDQQFGSNDHIFGRYTGAWQPDTSSGGVQGNVVHTVVDAYNLALSWSHVFSGNAVTQFTFGRVKGTDLSTPTLLNVPSDFLQTAGFSPNLTNHGPNPTLIPTFGSRRLSR